MVQPKEELYDKNGDVLNLYEILNKKFLDLNGLRKIGFDASNVLIMGHNRIALSHCQIKCKKSKKMIGGVYSVELTSKIFKQTDGENNNLHSIVC